MVFKNFFFVFRLTIYENIVYIFVNYIFIPTIIYIPNNIYLLQCIMVPLNFIFMRDKESKLHQLFILCSEKHIRMPTLKINNNFNFIFEGVLYRPNS